MYSYALLAVLASAAANADFKCHEPKTVDNFNINAFGNGVWYEVARYDNKIERGGECGYAEYKLENGVISLKNFDVFNGKLRSVSGSAQLADDAGTSGKLVYSYPYGASGAITKNIFNVIAVDNEKYAIGYYCNADEKQQELAWVLSRTKKLEGETKTAVENILKESTVIDSSKLIWPNFSDEACKVDA